MPDTQQASASTVQLRSLLWAAISFLQPENKITTSKQLHYIMHSFDRSLPFYGQNNWRTVVDCNKEATL